MKSLLRSLFLIALFAGATCGGSKGIEIKMPTATKTRPNPYRMIVEEPDGTLTTYDVALTGQYAKSWKLKTIDRNIVFFFVNANGQYDYADCKEAKLITTAGEVPSLGSAYRKYDLVITGDDPNMTQGKKKAEAMAILFEAASVPELAKTQTLQVCDSKFVFTEFDREVVKWFAAKYRERPAPEPVVEEPVTDGDAGTTDDGGAVEETPE